MPDIARNINLLRQRLSATANQYGRNPADITLLAVSKTRGPAAIRAAFDAGLDAFGENYLQEAEEKMAALADLPVTWHFIGPIQSNKTRAIASNFAWVHSVDRLKIARRLAAQRPDHLPPLNICLQVNIDREASKSGIDPDQVADLVEQIRELPRLRLRGLMAIPRHREDPDDQRKPFFRLRRLLDTLNRQHGAPALDTLSMGMTDDLEAAVAEGATIVRVGTAIFGARRKPTTHE